MDQLSLMQTIESLALSLAFGIVTVVLSIVVLIGVDRFLFRNIDFVEEMKKGNASATAFYCVQLIFVAIIIATAIS